MQQRLFLGILLLANNALALYSVIQLSILKIDHLDYDKLLNYVDDYYIKDRIKKIEDVNLVPIQAPEETDAIKFESIYDHLK